MTSTKIKKTMIRAADFYMKIDLLKSQHLNQPLTQRIIHNFEIHMHRLLLSAADETEPCLQRHFYLLEKRLQRSFPSLALQANTAKKNVKNSHKSAYYAI